MTTPKERAAALRKRLGRAIPDPTPELCHDGPWQLLIATILSAQSTDKTINEITPALFARYPSAAALGAAPPADVERLVKRSGFFRNKAKAIIGASRMVAEEHGGAVPRRLDELVRLPGVARKTANLVLGTAYRISSGMVIDTHAGRVARRLGLTAAEDPVEVEADLCALVPRRAWIDTGHRLVLHGRYLCQSRKPRCGACPVHEHCPNAEGEAEGRWTVRADEEAAHIAASREVSS